MWFETTRHLNENFSVFEFQTTASIRNSTDFKDSKVACKLKNMIRNNQEFVKDHVHQDDGRLYLLLSKRWALYF